MKYIIFIIALVSSSCSGQKLVKAELTRRYISEDGFCSTNYYLIDSTYFLREWGCEGNSHVSVGKWKLSSNRIRFTQSHQAIKLNDIDLQSFGIDYPDVEYEEWNKTIEMEYDKQSLRHGNSVFELVE